MSQVTCTITKVIRDQEKKIQEKTCERKNIQAQETEKKSAYQLLKKVKKKIMHKLHNITKEQSYLHVRHNSLPTSSLF